MIKMNTDKRPCTCQLEIEDCFCERDDEDFSKLRTKELSLLCEKMNQGRFETVMNSMNLDKVDTVDGATFWAKRFEIPKTESE